MGAVDTTKVADRRQLHFTCLDDIRAEVERLANSKELRTLGNWSAGQILQHLALAMNNSIDGFSSKVPGILRFLLRLFFKRRFLTRPMAAGFRLPAKSEDLLPPSISLEEGLQNFRKA